MRSSTISSGRSGPTCTGADVRDDGLLGDRVGRGRTGGVPRLRRDLAGRRQGRVLTHPPDAIQREDPDRARVRPGRGPAAEAVLDDRHLDRRRRPRPSGDRRRVGRTGAISSCARSWSEAANAPCRTTSGRSSNCSMSAASTTASCISTTGWTPDHDHTTQEIDLLCSRDDSVGALRSRPAWDAGQPSSEPGWWMMECEPGPFRISASSGGHKMHQPTLFLAVGLPGTGKTTATRRIEAEHGALRLTKDEWMKALFGRGNPASASDVIEGRLIDVGIARPRARHRRRHRLRPLESRRTVCPAAAGSGRRRSCRDPLLRAHTRRATGPPRPASGRRST